MQALEQSLLRAHQNTARREGQVAVRSSMRSQYEAGDNRAALIRSGVLDIIDDPALAGYGTLGGLVGTDQVNASLSRNPAIRRAIDLLPPPFTSAQKSRIKREPLTFVEEYVQANKNLVVSIVRRARAKKGNPRAVAIDDMTTRKRHTYRVDITGSSSWQDVFVAVVAMANKYPGEMITATAEQVTYMAQAGVSNVVKNITGMFGALGVTGVDDAAAAGGTAATITAVTGLITAIAAAAGTILPIITGITGTATGAPAAVTQKEIDGRPPAKKTKAQQSTGTSRTPYVPPVAARSGVSPIMIIGGVAAVGGAVLLLKKRK